MLPRRAFTLVELLVVISIIVVLMALVMGGVMAVRNSATRTKAVSLINTVAAAVNTYRSLNGVYPEKWTVPSLATDADLVAASTAITANGFTAPTMNAGDDVYGRCFSTAYGTAGAAAKAASAITADEWASINAVLVRQLMSIDASLGTKGNGLIVDPWGKPLRYRPSKWYPMSGTAGGSPRVDAEDAPNLDGIQIWSAGKNKTDYATDPGEGDDDLGNWVKRN